MKFCSSCPFSQITVKIFLYPHDIPLYKTLSEEFNKKYKFLGLSLNLQKQNLRGWWPEKVNLKSLVEDSDVHRYVTVTDTEPSFV